MDTSRTALAKFLEWLIGQINDCYRRAHSDERVREINMQWAKTYSFVAMTIEKALDEPSFAKREFGIDIGDGDD